MTDCGAGIKNKVHHPGKNLQKRNVLTLELRTVDRFLRSGPPDINK